MSDDIKVTEDASGRAVATDEVSGRNYQIIKLAFGDDGSVTLVGTNGLPVSGSLGRSWNLSSAGDSIAVTGTADVSGSNVSISNTVSVSGPLTNTQLRASDVPTGVADGSDIALGAKADAAASTDSATASLISLFKRLLGKITAVDTGNVTISASAIPTGAATAAGQNTGNTSISNVDVNIGAKADAAAGTDSATASLISLIKRLLGKFPSQGQALMASSQPVVIASDQSAIPVSGSFTVSGSSSKGYQPNDTDIGLLVRQIGEDNAYTQNILNGIQQLLRSVFQMTAAAGVPALNVQAYQATGTLLTTATNVTNWGSIGVHGVAGTVAPSLVSTNNDVVVAQSQAYHLPLVPQHIYSQIGV